ncbi:MAG: hypothetical protein ACYDA5_06245 [Vulcanimicrobiaceae bacterium]
MRRLALLLVVALGALGSVPRLPSADTVVARMLARNPSVSTYRARVHVNVRMLNFPFLSPQLRGTSYFKRPDRYEVVFDSVPGYAKGLRKLFDDVGDPAQWQRTQRIVVAGAQLLDGRPVYVLRLTNKIHSDVLDHTLAYVDATNYDLVRMEWHYTNGGVIVMRQWYRRQGPYSFVSTQQAEISIPHVHAVAQARYGTYHTNVAVSGKVFSQP